MSEQQYEPLSEERLGEIEARERRANVGPWFARMEGLDDGRPLVARVMRRNPRSGIDLFIATTHLAGAWDDAEFIAHSRADVPDLITEIRRCWALLAERVAGEEQDAERARKREAIREWMADGLPPVRAWQIRRWRVEGQRSYRQIANQAKQIWAYAPIEADQVHGALLCEVAAEMMGEEWT